jgi:hypothetical protein
MHVQADMLNDVGEIGAGERQVLKGPSEAPEVSQISNRRPRLDRDLAMCVHRCQNRLAVHYASSLKNIESKLMLSEEAPVGLMLYGDSQKMMDGPMILYSEFPLEGRYGLLQKCCTRCSEDNVINVKQKVYRICATPEDE